MLWLSVCRGHHHPEPKEIFWRERERRNGPTEALWGWASSLWVPLSLERRSLPLLPQDPLHAENSAPYQAHCTLASTGRDGHRRRQGDTGDADHQEITVASQARGRGLPMESLITPTLLELFPSILPALPYPHQPRARVPLRQGAPYLGKSLWRSCRPCPAAPRPS